MLVRQGLIVEAQRRDRQVAHDSGARKIADHLAAHTNLDDTIWVWGWHLWDVYPLASDRMSGEPDLQVARRAHPPQQRHLATPASKSLQFIPDSPHAERLLADLEGAPPTYIALGWTVPREQFTGLRRFLAARYERDRRIQVGKVEIWRRRET